MSTTQMSSSPKEVAAQEGLDTTRLLCVADRPPGPERTRDVLVDFTSSKDFGEIARRLNEKDAAKLVNVFDQVCRAGLQDTLTRLTTTWITRQYPSI